MTTGKKMVVVLLVVVLAVLLGYWLYTNLRIQLIAGKTTSLEEAAAAMQKPSLAIDLTTASDVQAIVDAANAGQFQYSNSGSDDLQDVFDTQINNPVPDGSVMSDIA